jgi:Domain of unknown function (DUF4604)
LVIISNLPLSQLSMAFNATNLHYEKQEPAFLRRLRSENNSDRHQVSVARPRKPRLENGDDDEPTIVDEKGETLTEKQYQQLLHGEAEDASVTKDISTTKPDPESEIQKSRPNRTDDMGNERETPRLASSVLKKRKQVKAVAAEAEPVAEHLTLDGDPSTAKRDGESGIQGRNKKKKIKLSFDDPET